MAAIASDATEARLVAGHWRLLYQGGYAERVRRLRGGLLAAQLFAWAVVVAALVTFGVASALHWDQPWWLSLLLAGVIITFAVLAFGLRQRTAHFIEQLRGPRPAAVTRDSVWKLTPEELQAHYGIDADYCRGSE
jgi:RsiW-degrading membrane proteinase PrsW (M82 family)